MLIMQDGTHFHMIHSHASLLDASLCQIDSQTGIIELPIVIYNTTLQAITLDSWQTAQHTLLADKL